MGWMGLWWILAAALVIVVAWALLGATRGAVRHDSPEAILKRRYANGEIDEPTYERMLGEVRK